MDPAGMSVVAKRPRPPVEEGRTAVRGTRELWLKVEGGVEGAVMCRSGRSKYRGMVVVEPWSVFPLAGFWGRESEEDVVDERIGLVWGVSGVSGVEGVEWRSIFWEFDGSVSSMCENVMFEDIYKTNGRSSEVF
jgi:hypothetical protein